MISRQLHLRQVNYEKNAKTPSTYLSHRQFLTPYRSPRLQTSDFNRQRVPGTQNCLLTGVQHQCDSNGMSTLRGELRSGALGAVLGVLACLAPGAGAATGTIQDVQHVVILTMENRSFDHYYGCFPGVRGFNDRNALVFPNGNNVFFQPFVTNYVWPFLCSTQCVGDVAHDWSNGHLAVNQGKWDQWVLAKTPATMPYFTRTDLVFYYALAEAYTVCDAYHCSVVGPTIPNRFYQLTGTIDPQGNGGGPVTNNNSVAGGYRWSTYPERLQSHGITWKVYQQDNWGGNPLIFFAQYQQAQPGSPLYDRGMTLVTNIITAFSADVSNGTLPQVSWIAPNWFSSEHPAQSPSVGGCLIKPLLDALAANPAVYNSTVFIVCHDENGGYFDHIPAPRPPPGTPDEFVGGLPIGLGPRVPMIIISPWTRGGFVCSQVFDHTSIIRFLEAWTGVYEPNISGWRRQVCGDLTSAFDFTLPDTNYPSLPAVTSITCTGGVYLPVPSPQVFPVQEPGSRPARPLPYQPDVSGSVQYPLGTLWLTLTNGGCASVHLAVYANAYRTDGPWSYDVAACTSQRVLFGTQTNTGGRYDFTCYGPNGFQRRFAGQCQTNCGLLEISSSIDPVAGGIQLTLTNATSAIASFTVSNGYQGTGPWTYTIPAGQTATDTYFVVTNNGGWYDLTVTVDIDPAFLRRLAGHIEPVPTYPPHPGPPFLSASFDGGNLVFSYPAAAGAYTLESTPDLFSTNWTSVTVSSNVLCGSTLLTMPPPPAPAYFRLRQ